jgi:serine/threonine-protein kinase
MKILQSFADRLLASGVLTPEQARELRSLPPECLADPRTLGRALLERDWVTPFQLNQIHRGHGDWLVLGSYLLLKLLGRGGMGEVFKACHRRLDRLVALKLIRADRLSKPKVVRRFLREIEAAGRLDQHPNVVHAYDAGQEGGRLFLALEYVDGPNLGQLVQQRGPLPVADACDYVRQAALGLQHAFEQGVVHRDIKPSNLLLCSRTSTIKVLDLGLARLRRRGRERSGEQLTRANRTLGTLDYMAPEQAFNARGADTRSDLYALGCTFYYLLTGRPPFPGGTPMQTVRRHVGEQPEPVEVLQPGVPSEVAQVVRKLLAKRPEDRYQTPAELAATLGERSARLSGRKPARPGEPRTLPPGTPQPLGEG